MPYPPAIRHHDSTRSFVCFIARPVALELQKHLYPAGKLNASFLQSAKSQVVAIGSQAAHASAAMETSNSSLSAVGAEKETQASVI